MPATVSSSPSPSISEWSAELTASFVAGFHSTKTRSNYSANLRDWFAWTEATGTEPCQIQRRVVEAYVGRLEEAGYAPNTICQRIATLSSFYRWAVAEDHLTRNPVEGARRPRKPAESTAQGLSRHEVTDWLDAAETRGGSAYACACLLALGRPARRRALRCQHRRPRRVNLAPPPHPTGRGHQGRQGRRDRSRPADGASHQPRVREPTLRRAAAQPTRAAHDELQRRLPRQGAVPRDRRWPAHHAAQPATLGDHAGPRCGYRAARRAGLRSPYRSEDHPGVGPISQPAEPSCHLRHRAISRWWQLNRRQPADAAAWGGAIPLRDPRG